MFKKLKEKEETTREGGEGGREGEGGKEAGAGCHGLGGQGERERCEERVVVTHELALDQVMQYTSEQLAECGGTSEKLTENGGGALSGGRSCGDDTQMQGHLPPGKRDALYKGSARLSCVA
jgi:hypothetical protein